MKRNTLVFQVGVCAGRLVTSPLKIFVHSHTSQKQVSWKPKGFREKGTNRKTCNEEVKSEQACFLQQDGKKKEASNASAHCVLNSVLFRHCESATSKL